MLGIMPKPTPLYPSLLQQLYKDNRIKEQVISFWKDRASEGIYVHFGALDLSVVTQS